MKDRNHALRCNEKCTTQVVSHPSRLSSDRVRVVFWTDLPRSRDETRRDVLQRNALIGCRRILHDPSRVSHFVVLSSETSHDKNGTRKERFVKMKFILHRNQGHFRPHSFVVGHSEVFCSASIVLLTAGRQVSLEREQSRFHVDESPKCPKWRLSLDVA